MERRHQYRRSEIRYRSKKARKTLGSGNKASSLDRNKIKERRESFISYSREELFQNESGSEKKCENHTENCENCAKNDKEAEKEADSSKKSQEDEARSKSESRFPDEMTNKIESSDSLFSTLNRTLSSRIVKPEIKMYNSKTLPKRIANLKKNRAKTAKETSTFYMDIPDEATQSNASTTTILKIVEPLDAESLEAHDNKANESICSSSIASEPDSPSAAGPKKKDSEIISQLILDNTEIKRKLSKPMIIRRKSFDTPENRSLSERSSIETISGRSLLELSNGNSKSYLDKCSSNISLPITPISSSNYSLPTTPKEEAVKPPLLPQKMKQSQSQPEVLEAEPIYESLLRNVHVPYKFAPPLLRRSVSHQNDSSLKLKIPLPKPENPKPQVNSKESQENHEEDEDSDRDYVTLAYSDNVLATVDGEEVKRTTKSTPSTPPSATSRINHEIMMMSTSDTNINYCKTILEKQLREQELLKQGDNSEVCSLNSSINDLERRGSLSTKTAKTLLQRFIGLKISEAGIDDHLSQKSVSTSASRKSLSERTELPPSYRQGSEDMGSRIAHGDYADPRTLFHTNNAPNIFINKAALKSQRDSVFSSSSDSVCDPNQKSLHTSEDFCYEKSVEDCLENDFRDSAVYSDDNNDKRLESLLATEEHIYASVQKKDKKPPPPKIPKKPSLLMKPTQLSPLHSPPPVPVKPSCLKTPDAKKVLLNFNRFPSHSNLPTPVNSRLSSASSKSSLSPSPGVLDESSSKSWVLQQVQKYQ